MRDMAPPRYVSGRGSIFRMLGAMAKGGGQYYANIDAEAKRSQRIKEAEERRKGILAESRAYEQKLHNQRREERQEDAATARDLNRESALQTRKDLDAYQQENPTFKQVVRTEDENGEGVYGQLMSDGTIKRTDHKIASTGNPEASRWKHIDGVRKEISTEVGKLKFNKAKEAMGKMTKAFKEGNSMSDVAMVFYFMKTLDPESVVRESEFKSVADARAYISNEYKGVTLPSSVTQWLSKIEGNGSLLQEQREQILDLTIDAYNNKAKIAEGVINSYRPIAKDRGWADSDLRLGSYDTSRVSRESLFGKPAKVSNSKTLGADAPLEDLLGLYPE